MFSYIKTTNPSGKAARICMSADYTHIGTAINVKNFVLPLVDHERKMISESLRDDRLRRFGHSCRTPIPREFRKLLIGSLREYNKAARVARSKTY